MVITERALRRLFPGGHAFRLPATIGQVVSAIALSTERLRTFFLTIPTESLPFTSVMTLPAWYQALGLNYDSTKAQADQQAQVDAAWSQSGGQYLSYLNAQIQKELPQVYISEILFGSNMGAFYPNWIANGNCEAGVPTLGGVEAPTGSTFAQSSAQAHSGTYSALYTKTAGSGYPGYLTLGNWASLNGLIPGHTYSLTLWMYVPSAGFQATDISVAFTSNSGLLGHQVLLASAQPFYGSWQQLFATFSISPNATYAYLLFNTGLAEGNYTFYVDDLVLNDMSVPPVITFADSDARMNIGHVGVVRMNASDQSMTYNVLGTVPDRGKYNRLLAILARIAPLHLFPNINVVITAELFIARMNVAQMNNARVGKGS